MTILDDIIADTLGTPPSRGRRPKEIHAVVVRELTPDDIARLHELKDKDLGSSLPPLQRLRHSHHNLARLVASGERDEVCSLITGYDTAYISNLKRDPAFSNLVAYYKEQVETVFVDVLERLKMCSVDFLEELHSRLVANPDGFSNREIMEAITLGFDRSGFGPSSTVKHNATVALVTAADLARIKDDVASRQTGSIKTLDPSSNRGPPVGALIDGRALETAEEPERLPREGPDISEESGT